MKRKRFDLATILGIACGRTIRLGRRIIRWWRRTPSEYEAWAVALAGVALLVIVWIIHVQNVATVTLMFFGLIAICVAILWRLWDETRDDDWEL